MADTDEDDENISSSAPQSSDNSSQSTDYDGVAANDQSNLTVPPILANNAGPTPTVDEITVQAARPQINTSTQDQNATSAAGQPVNYSDPNINNSTAVQQADQVNAANLGKNNSNITGAGANPGIWGLLPANVQHGTFRNILGAIGDAFLVGSGHQPVYGPRMQAQAEGQALVGFDKDPSAAANRLAALGYPGTGDQAMKLQDEAQTMALRKQIQEQNNAYRQGNLDIRQDQERSQADARQDAIENRARQAIGGILTGAYNTGNPAAYTAARQRAIALGQRTIKNFDPDTEVPADITEFVPGQGMTAGQETTGNNYANRTAQFGADNAANNQTKLQVAGMRPAPQPNATVYTKQLIAKANSGQQLTPYEQKYLDAQTTRGGSQKTRPVLIPPTQGGKQQQQQFVRTAVGANGHRLGQTADGRWVQIN